MYRLPSYCDQIRSFCFDCRELFGRNCCFFFHHVQISIITTNDSSWAIGTRTIISSSVPPSVDKCRRFVAMQKEQRNRSASSGCSV